MVKNSSILKWSLTISIVLVLNLFFAFAIKVFYPEPDYSNFCENKQVKIVPDNKKECLIIGGQWTGDQYLQRKLPNRFTAEVPVIETQKKGYCSPNYTCNKEYQDSSNLYQRNVFVVLTILGTLLIIGSFAIVQFGVVSFGFSLGGILALIIGTMRYWSSMDDYLRVGILGVALIALIWLGIKKFKD